MWCYYYPVIGGERSLPLCVVGIGVNDVQYHVVRENGYYLPQLLYSTEGRGILKLGGKEYEITPNQLFFLPRDLPHEYYTVEGELWDTHWLVLDGNAVDEILEMFGFKKFGLYPLSDMTRLEHTFKKIYTTLKTDKLYGNYYAGGFAYDYLVELYRIVNNKVSAVQGIENVAMVAVVDYIDGHYSEEITLDRLSEVAGVTKQHLCKLFRKTLDMRPVEYITKIRIQHAKRLLLSTNDTVKSIAESLGFGDSGYFCQIFRRYELMSPLDYRKTSNKT